MPSLSSEQIKQYLPHRYPFLLVDKVTDYVVYESLTAIKNVTADEPCFQGHFPEQAIYPGVLITESMAQAAALLGALSMGEETRQDALYLLVGIDKVRFKQPVVPGDQLVISVSFDKVRRGIWRFATVATVDGKEVSSGELITTVTDKKD